MLRAWSSEYFAGTALNELSECQSRLPMAKRRRRSSRANTRLSLSRLDTSANVVGSRSSSAARRLVPMACSMSPRLRVKASCCSSSRGWSWNTSTAYRSMPAWTAATSSGDSGRVRSRPETSAAKHGPIWRMVTDMGATSSRIAPIVADSPEMGDARAHRLGQEPEALVVPAGVVGGGGDRQERAEPAAHLVQLLDLLRALRRVSDDPHVVHQGVE